MKRLIEPFLMPPLGPFVLIFVGLVLRKRRPRLAKGLIVCGVGSLFLLSQPYVAAALLISLQNEEALDRWSPLPEADAIVILGGDIDSAAPEYGGAGVGPLSLQRVRYGAHLAKRRDIPVLVTGGAIQVGETSVGQLMAAALEEFGVETRWVEDRALDTRQNAEYSAELLHAGGVKRVLLVSHAWHLARAKRAFEAAGLEVIAAPTAFRAWPDPTKPDAYLPSTRSLRESGWGLHEWVGRLWYAVTE